MGVKHLVTAEDLRDLPEIPGKKVELIDGELVEVPGAGMLHGLIVLVLSRILDDFVRHHDLGLVVPDGVAYALRRDPDQVRIPDVSFIARASVSDEDISEGFWEGPPTLAVEVVSPNDRADDIHDKVQHYLEAGTSQVWLLWPRRRSISVYDRSGEMRELGTRAILDGGELLPGFQVRVADVFEVRQRQ